MLPGAQHHLLDTAWNENKVGENVFFKVGPAIQRVALPFPWDRGVAQNRSERRSRRHFRQTGSGALQRDDFSLATRQKPTASVSCCSYSSYRESEQRLGSNDNERFAKVPDHLSPQQVEILSRGGGVDYSHVHGVTVDTLLSTVAHLSDNRKDSALISLSQTGPTGIFLYFFPSRSSITVHNCNQDWAAISSQTLQQ